MTDAPEPHSRPEGAPRSGPGLRLRLWLACLAGGLVAGAGTLWVLGTQVPAGFERAPALLAWLSGVAFAAILVGLALALWLDAHLAVQLRGLLEAARTGRVSELRGLPAASGWGELSDLGDALRDALVQHRQHARAAWELERARGQLATLSAAIEHWQRTESWETPALPDGEVAAIAQRLGHAIERGARAGEQNLEAARLVVGELSGALGDAQESAEQAERGFVEATALLTTVRELQRLSLELGGALAAPSGEPAARAAPDAGEVARATLEDLVSASGGSVEALGHGLLRVQDVAEQVQKLANRATLIAIEALTAGHADPALGEELKQLARDVREATDRTTQFAIDIETAVAEASERMRAARERALARLAPPGEPEPAPARAPRAGDDVQRLLERVREMVQDAARKGERLSATGERASRAAERLARRVEGGAAEAAALAVRLAPVGETPPSPPSEEESRGLWLLERDDEGGHAESGPSPRHEEERP